MKRILLFLAAAAAAMGQVQTNRATIVRVAGDNVSLRPEPSLECEVLHRAMRGEEMLYLDRTNNWVAVVAPTNLDFWVAGKYVDEGVVLPKKLNVRAGPSMNYNKIAIAMRGEQLDIRDEFNGWLRIAPPAGSRVWISADYVEIIEPPKPKPEPEPVKAPAPEPDPEPIVVVAPAPRPDDSIGAKLLVLDPEEKQGVVESYPGVLRRASPGLFKLVMVSGGFEETICFVKGDIAQMEQFLGQALRLEGPIYRPKDLDVPVMMPSVIEPNPLLEDN